METFTLNADQKQITAILSFFPDDRIKAGKDYIEYQIKDDGITITIYTSHKVVFSGRDAAHYYRHFSAGKNITLPQAGSDEVGTGDFFGPVCVCASWVDENVYRQIEDLNLTDSKQLSDEYIRKIGQRLIDCVPHSLLILENQQYNDVVKSNNMNRIKARMHNQAYINLQKKGFKLPDLCVVDDFCGKTLYYKYLLGTPDVFEGLTFQTKAESSYISVAIGSIISRFAFLQYMDQLSLKYGMEFPKGASALVDEFAVRFVEKHGLDELKKVAKCNFANYQKLL